MYVGKTLFAQVMEQVPWTSFARIVQRHAGDARVRTLSCAEQFRALAFAQLTWRESLRDIEASLSANSGKLYSMGLRSAVKKQDLQVVDLPVSKGVSGPSTERRARPGAWDAHEQTKFALSLSSLTR